MSNRIAVVNQTQIETEVLANPRLTMALPYLAPLLVPQIPEKKLIQKTLWGKVAVAPAPEYDLVQVQSHYRGSTKVQAHKRTITAKPHGNKKKTKTNKSKQKTGQNKHSAFPKGPDDCKESVQLAYSLHIKEMKSLFNSFKK
jgi:hypothetical protein